MSTGKLTPTRQSYRVSHQTNADVGSAGVTIRSSSGQRSNERTETVRLNPGEALMLLEILQTAKDAYEWGQEEAT